MEERSPTIDFAVLREGGRLTYDEEGLFARDVNGQLIRVERATADDFDTDVQVTIDGIPLTIKRAVPQRDSQGNVIRDAKGQPVPRYSTIYDAAQMAFVKAPGDANPIPTLCHREHLPPVGVCRICIVEAAEMTRRGARKMLVPACVQRVSDQMAVHTLESKADLDAAARVKAAVKLLTELLVSDHLPHQEVTTGRDIRMESNELAQLARRLGIEESRFQTTPRTTEIDNSSPMISVDLQQCILCGRCARGCDWLKGNNVIGRSGKGYDAFVSFDLGMPMGESSCVSCGECAISCPTGALEFTPQFIQNQVQSVLADLKEEDKSGEIVPIEELITIPLFAGIPPKFLQFNGGAIVRRHLKSGDVLCREGEYGSTAFIILKGKFEVFLSTPRGAVKTVGAKGWRGWFGGLRTFATKGGGAAKLADIAGATLAEDQRIIRTSEDVILGEMTCMNRYPRSATVVAIEDGEILEIRRNVLYMLQRNEASRNVLDRVYRKRSLTGKLQDLPIFATLSDASRKQAAQFLGDKAEIVFVDPGQVILAQGDRAENFYITKLGFVKVSQTYGREDRVLTYLGPGNYFGEIGLLSEISHLLTDPLGAKVQPSTCTATCSALDHVELIRIRGEHFRELLQRFPEIVEPLVKSARQILQRDEQNLRSLDASGSTDFLDQGLYTAKNLLVLDLDRCTRCDECTKACADTHGGVTRLVRDGMRFDRFLVASSCRSCMDPYCLVGCPVDAIHRNGDTHEISISDFCIGCGLCATNCPYGNINMHEFPKTEVDVKSGKEIPVFQIVDGNKKPVIQMRATTCDLCVSVDGRPSCVYACPHNAAFRMSGEELLKKVNSYS
jgi:CRP-like cAMP-binding protein/Fe-S-cluster-containing hydrogenase component 2